MLFETEFGDIPLSQFTPERVRQFAVKRRATVGSDTLMRDLAQLSSIVEWAQVMWDSPLGANPVRAAVARLRKTQTIGRKVNRERRLAPGEYRRLLRASSPRLRQIVRLIIETGLRRGEVVRLRPDDLGAGGLWVRGDKTGKTTLIPVSRAARRIIGGMEKTGFGVRPDSITQAFERAVKRAGLVDLRVHDLRHECASRLFEKGLSVPEVAMITRHSDWRSLKVYTQPSVEKVAGKLG